MSITRKRLIVALGATLVVAGIGTFTAMHGFGRGDLPVNGAEAAVKPSAPAMEVDVAMVVSKTITDYQNYSGRLEAVDKVEIRPLVPGTIVAVHFADGALVKKGDALFTIDPRPYVGDQGRRCSAREIGDGRDTAGRQRDDADFNGLLIDLLGLFGGAALKQQDDKHRRGAQNTCGAHL